MSCVTSGETEGKPADASLTGGEVRGMLYETCIRLSEASMSRTIAEPGPGPRPVVFKRVYDGLEALIADRDVPVETPAGPRLPSEADLTRRFDCSRVTIRRVLAAFEREGRIRRLPGKGTFLAAAQDQDHARTPSRPRIAWWCPTRFAMGESVWGNAVFRVLERHAADEAENIGVHLEQERSLPRTSRDLLKWARRHRADAVVLQPPEYRDSGEVAYFKTDVPVVFLNRSSPFPDEVSSVTVDQYSGMRGAVELLLRFGHRRIACAVASLNSTLYRSRRKAVVDALSAQGIEPIHPWCVSSIFSDIAEHMLGLMSREDRPTAIIPHGDVCVSASFHALAAAGLRIPDDVSLLVVDDFPHARDHKPPISVIRQPIESLVEHAIQLARERALSPNDKPRQVTLQSEIVLRQSIAPVDV